MFDEHTIAVLLLVVSAIAATVAWWQWQVGALPSLPVLYQALSFVAIVLYCIEKF